VLAVSSAHPEKSNSPDAKMKGLVEFPTGILLPVTRQGYQPRYQQQAAGLTIETLNKRASEKSRQLMAAQKIKEKKHNGS
jgi:hypothetical protein